MIVKVSVVFLLICTLLKSAQGIVGANLVKIEDFSYNIYISYTDSAKSFYISGSIIHKKFILTHGSYFIDETWNADKSFVKSIRSRNIRDMKVEALTDRRSNSEKNKITEKVKTLHFPQECFNSNTTNTHGRLVILELQNDLDISRGIQVLKLPTVDLWPMKDYEKFAVFTGFGSDLKGKHSSGLKSMEVAIVDCPRTSLEASDWSTFCGGSIILQENIENSYNQSLGAWGGDQGGPLVYRKNTIIGMMGTGFNDGDDRLGQNHPARYINISHYFDFINDVISGLPSLHVTVAIPSS